MKKIYFLLVILFLSMTSFAQVKLIFDTDFGGDADDLGALAMLHHFIDKGECELLAIMCWSTEQYAVSGIDAVNRFYNHPDILIGSRKDKIHSTDWGHGRPIAEKFPHQLNANNTPDATSLYREVLAKSDDQSVVIITVPITFSGFEVGEAIKTGVVFNEIDHNTPLYVGFKHFSEHAPWIKKNYQGKIIR